MKLEVPFVRNLDKWKGEGWCGPLSLACILRYYGHITPVKEIVKLADTASTGGTCPQGLISVCLRSGLGVDYFAKSEVNLLAHPDYSERLKKFLTNINAEELDKNFLEKNKTFKDYRFSARQQSIKDIERFLSGGKPVLMIHNASFLSGFDEKLQPHYIAIVGYDKDNFYIHNHAKGNHKFQKVNKKLLENSWDFDGFGRTLIVPHKK